jgi:hypothetical protein
LTLVLAWLAWCTLAALLLVGMVRWLQRSRQIIAPLPIFLGTIALYVLPRSAYLLWFDRAPLTSGGLLPDSQHVLIAATLALCVAGVAAFLVGHARPSTVRFANSLRFSVPEPDAQRAFWISSGTILVGGAALAYLILSVGGIGYALRHQYEMSALLDGKQPILQLTRILIVPIALLLVRRSHGTTRFTLWVFAVVVTVALFPLGRRGLLVMLIAYPVALYHLMVRRIPGQWLLVGSILAGVVVFSLSYLRGLGGSHLAQAARVFQNHPAAAMHFAFNATGELKIFDAATIIVRDVPDEIEFTAGKSFARVPFMVIPRQLWPTKPVTLGEIIVSRNLPHLRTGYPPLAVGEFYAAAGPFAVLLGCFLLGWIARVGWEWWTRRSGLGNTAFYLVFCFFVFDFTRVGDPSRTAWTFIIGAALLLVAFEASAARTKPGMRTRLAE